VNNVLTVTKENGFTSYGTDLDAVNWNFYSPDITGKLVYTWQVHKKQKVTVGNAR
jgi:hypothetical protein